MTPSSAVCKFGESNATNIPHSFPVSFESAWGAGDMPRVALLAISMAMAGYVTPSMPQIAGALT
jgi:hypothetical protein